MSAGAFEATLREVLRAGYAARFRAQGDSMHPTIRYGEYLHVEQAVGMKLGVGDVVLASTTRGLTAHRIVGLRRGANGECTVTMRGDNAALADSPFPVANILGIITAAERNGRRVIIHRNRTISDRFAHSWVRGARKVRRGMACLWFRGKGSASTARERL